MQASGQSKHSEGSAESRLVRERVNQSKTVIAVAILIRGAMVEKLTLSGPRFLSSETLLLRFEAVVGSTERERREATADSR